MQKWRDYAGLLNYSKLMIVTFVQLEESRYSMFQFLLEVEIFTILSRSVGTCAFVQFNCRSLCLDVRSLQCVLVSTWWLMCLRKLTNSQMNYKQSPERWMV